MNSSTICGLRFCHRFLIPMMFAPALAFAQGSSTDAVSALGRLEPKGGVIHVAAALTPRSISGALITELLVNSGDDVTQGQLLAVTDTAPIMQALVVESEAEYELTVRRAQTENSRADEACVRARVAEQESQRRSALLKKGVAGEEEAETAAGVAEALAASCKAAKTAAYSAQAEIAVAGARLNRHRAELERSYVRAPRDGRVLKIVASVGELAAGDGVLELGQVDQMYAIAEVYETDIDRVNIGQRATISSDALPADLEGTVEKIRFKVAKQDAIGTDPAARKDARIVEVEIRLDDSSLAMNLTHLQVEVVIEP